jgi:hypothetical protein
MKREDACRNSLMMGRNTFYSLKMGSSHSKQDRVVLFETYGSLLNLLPQSVDEPNEIWMSCAVPKCDYKLKVFTLTSPRNLGNWIKHSQTHHPYLLTDEDRKDLVRTDQTSSKRPRSDNDAVTKEQQVSQVKLVVTAGLPLSFVEYSAFRQNNKDHDIQTTLSRRTATRITQELEDKEVVIPRSAILTKVFEQETLTHGSIYMSVRSMISASVDGWTSKSGQMLDSLTLTVPYVTEPVTGGPFTKPSQLRPHAVWLGLYHLLPGNLKECDADDDIPAGKFRPIPLIPLLTPSGRNGFSSLFGLQTLLFRVILYSDSDHVWTSVAETAYGLATSCLSSTHAHMNVYFNYLSEALLHLLSDTTEGMSNQQPKRTKVNDGCNESLTRESTSLLLLSKDDVTKMCPSHRHECIRRLISLQRRYFADAETFRVSDKMINLLLLSLSTAPIHGDVPMESARCEIWNFLNSKPLLLVDLLAKIETIPWSNILSSMKADVKNIENKAIDPFLGESLASCYLYINIRFDSKARIRLNKWA